MKQEVEVAMRLLEKDGHDKQELVASLRKQLEDVKNINIDMSNRLQVCNVLNYFNQFSLFTSAKEVMIIPSICLSVCLSL